MIKTMRGAAPTGTVPPAIPPGPFKTERLADTARQSFADGVLVPQMQNLELFRYYFSTLIFSINSYRA